MLTDKQIEKFQALYKKHFGKEVSREHALEEGIQLIRLVSLVYQPITQQEYEEVVAKKLRKTKSNEEVSNDPRDHHN